MAVFDNKDDPYLRIYSGQSCANDPNTASPDRCAPRLLLTALYSHSALPETRSSRSEPLLYVEVCLPAFYISNRLPFHVCLFNYLADLDAVVYHSLNLSYFVVGQ